MRNFAFTVLRFSVKYPHIFLDNNIPHVAAASKREYVNLFSVNSDLSLNTKIWVNIF